jgi:hypothetical protein
MWCVRAVARQPFPPPPCECTTRSFTRGLPLVSYLCGGSPFPKGLLPLPYGLQHTKRHTLPSRESHSRARSATRESRRADFSGNRQDPEMRARTSPLKVAVEVSMPSLGPHDAGCGRKECPARSSNGEAPPSPARLLIWPGF